MTLTTSTTSAPRTLRRFALVTTVAVGATFGAAIVSGAATSPGAPPPAVAPSSATAHTPPPRFLPVVGPTGKPVVDDQGRQLLMDTAPETGEPNPNGQTVLATLPPAAASHTGAGDASTPASIVRPYDDTKYHER